MEQFKIIPQLKNLVERVHHSNLDKDRVADAMNVAKLTRILLKEEKLLEESTYSSMHSTIILVGALLHNCGATREEIKDDVCKLFAHRQIIEKAYRELLEEDERNAFAEQYLDVIYSVIESQFGKSTKVTSLIPNSGHAGFYVSLACGIYYSDEVEITL